jgi:UPF0716 family protein affecting phage T7 exclusion
MSSGGPVSWRRARLRRRATWLGTALLAVPILEIIVAIQVQRRVGTTVTILMLLAACAAGTVIVRRVGLQALRRLPAPGREQSRAASGRPAPDAALLVLAGVLLIVPGFVTDAAGLLLLLPPVRRGLIALVARRFWSRWSAANSHQVIEGQVIRDEPGEGTVDGTGGSPRSL